VVTLSGHEDSGNTLEYYITSLPATGTLHETSQNYRTFGTDPKAQTNSIAVVPHKVTDSLFRVVYIPPYYTSGPDGFWASFEYEARDTVTADISDRTKVVLTNQDNHVVKSTFLLDDEGWTIGGDTVTATPTHQILAWGGLNRYIHATDSLQLIDFSTGTDTKQWYFLAPAKFYSAEVWSAFGGTLAFTVRSTYGLFSRLNSPVEWIVLECSTCDSGRGLRLVRFTDANLSWDGSEKTVSVVLDSTSGWLVDPKNQSASFTAATDCDIAAVLKGLTAFKILGDFTQAGEGVAIDNISFQAKATQPALAVNCQKGCICAHSSTLRRFSCCPGSAP